VPRGDEDALLAAPEVHEHRPAAREDARGERRVVGAVAVAQVQRGRVRAVLPERREPAEAAGRADAVRRARDAVQERVVAAGEAQPPAAVERAAGVRDGVAGDPGGAPRRQLQDAEAGELRVRAPDRRRGRAQLRRGDADARQRGAWPELAAGDVVQQPLGDVAVPRHRDGSYDGAH
jgi:hypothetical protein